MKKILVIIVALVTISAACFGQTNSVKYAVRSLSTFEIQPTLNPATTQTWSSNGQSRKQFLFFDIGNQFDEYFSLYDNKDDTLDLEHIYLEENNFQFRFLTNDFMCANALEFKKIKMIQSDNSEKEIFTSSNKVDLADVTISNLPLNFQTLVTDSVLLKIIGNLGNVKRMIKFKYTIIPKSDDHYEDAAGNTMTVWKSSHPNGIPIVAAEGVDFTDTRPAQYYWRLDGAEMFNCMLDAGFDIYMVDFARGQVDIAYNARHFQYAIRKIAQDVGKEVVATGFSMGGIINRYACAEAEDIGNPLPISHMVCIDAPHQGAIINRDMQELLFQAEEFLRTEVVGAPFDACAEYDGLRKIDFQMSALKSQAALQLLKFNRFDPNIFNNLATQHDLLYSTLNSLNGDGYPHIPKTVAISFGDLTTNPGNLKIADVFWDSGLTGNNDNNLEGRLDDAGISTSMYNYGNGFSWVFKAEIFNDTESSQVGSFFPEFTYRKLGVKHIANRFLFDIDTKNKAQMTFMPTNSTLDLQISLDTSSSKFEVPIVADKLYDHDNIPWSVKTPLLIAVLKDDVLIQNRTYTSQQKVFGVRTITAGSNVDISQATGSVVIAPSANVEFRARESITLEAGFITQGGALFNAIIHGNSPNCGDVFQQGHTVDNSTVLQQEESEEIIIGQSSKPFKVGVYPNPIESGELHVDLKVEAEGAASIKLFSMDGKMVLTVNTPTTLTEGEHQFQLNTNELRAGMYFLEVIVDNQRQITKVVKQ